jgi:hypothetical protein
MSSHFITKMMIKPIYFNLQIFIVQFIIDIVSGEEYNKQVMLSISAIIINKNVSMIREIVHENHP